MKFATFFTFTVVLLISLSCKQKTIDSNVNRDWTSLTIDEEDHRTVITINNQNDTSDVRLNDYGSIFTGSHKAKVDSLKTYFTHAEKDTIFNLLEDIISKPVSNHKACTDFVGDIELTIYYDGYNQPGSCKQSIAYSGVCNWDSVSVKTEQLSALLKRKIKFKKK
jgi:hypothetical protein